MLFLHAGIQYAFPSQYGPEWLHQHPTVAEKGDIISVGTDVKQTNPSHDGP